MVRVLAMCGVVLAGCATTSGSSAPLKNVERDFLAFTEAADASTARWHRVDAGEFAIVSDLPLERLKEAAQRLAQTFAATNALFRRLPQANDQRLVVLAIANQADFEQRLSPRVRFVTATTSEHVLLFVPGQWFDTPSVQTTVTQVVLNRHFPTQPRWLPVGMAAFLSTLRWSSADSVSLGVPNKSAYAVYRDIRSVGVSDLRTWNGDESDRTRLGLVGEAWAFVHWALTHETERFTTYLTLLTNGDDEAAWQKTFAPIEDSIDTAVYRAMRSGDFRSADVTVPQAPPREVMVQAVREEDVKKLEGSTD